MARPKKETEAKGLGDEVQVAKLVPAVQPGDLQHGVLAKYVRTEERKSKGFDRPQKLHILELGQAFNRVRFALWGAVSLDLKLAALNPGQIALLVYEGLEKDAARGRTKHHWSVRPFRGTTEDAIALAAQYREGSETVAAAVASIEARAEGQDFAEGDDDIPF